MSVPVKERWTEEDVRALPVGEPDNFERKGGDILLDDGFETKLAKALSALSNSGGGSVFLGVRDDRTFDGLEPRRGRTATRDWLEQVIPNLLDFPLEGFRVHEVERAESASIIPSQRVVIAIDVPDSERAPHQSQLDKKYYVRLGGHSVPASHRMIEDIRNRARHPDIRLEKIGVLSVGRASGRPPANSEIGLRLKWTLANVGRLKATNCCLLTVQDGAGSFAPDDTSGALVTSRPFDGWRGAYWEFQYPIYPEMKTDLTCRFSSPANYQPSEGVYLIPGSSKSVAWIEFSWKIYADNAPVKSGMNRLKAVEFWAQGEPPW